MILPSDPLVVSQPRFRSGPVSNSLTWVQKICKQKFRKWLIVNIEDYKFKKTKTKCKEEARSS
jgi:hypothetical protein